MGHCLCFNLLFYKGSMVIFKIIISLTTGKGQFRCPRLYCLGSYLGSLLWVLGHYSRAKFLPNSIMAPSIKTSLSLLSYLFFLLLDYTIPSSSPLPPLSTSFYPLPLCSQIIFCFHFPGGSVYVFLWLNLIFSFSWIMNHRLDAPFTFA